MTVLTASSEVSVCVTCTFQYFPLRASPFQSAVEGILADGLLSAVGSKSVQILFTIVALRLDLPHGPNGVVPPESVLRIEKAGYAVQAGLAAFSPALFYIKLYHFGQHEN